MGSYFIIKKVILIIFVKVFFWKFIEILNFNLYYKIFILNEKRKLKQSFNRDNKIASLKNIEDFNAKKYKTSDTLFVLGSGASINSLKEEHWQEIRNSDSIGFNFWPLHDFVPTYYVFEVPFTHKRRELLIEILNSKSKDYSNTPIIKKTSNVTIDLNRFNPVIIDNLYLSNDIELPGMLKFSDVLDRISCDGKLDELSYLLRKRASLSYMIFFAIRCGYKKIVLCGVDLNNTNYFYDNIDYSDKFSFSKMTSEQSGNLHKTMNSNSSNLTIDKVILEINQKILKKHNIYLYIGSKSSILYPKLKYFFTD